MGVLYFLALWAYCMAAFSNPGIVDVEVMKKYDKDDLNRKLINMFKSKALDSKVEKEGGDFEDPKGIN